MPGRVDYLIPLSVCHIKTEALSVLSKDKTSKLDGLFSTRVLPRRCALLRAHTSKTMPHRKFIDFFNTNFDFFKSAHFKNFSTHEEKILEETFPYTIFFVTKQGNCEYHCLKSFEADAPTTTRSRRLDKFIKLGRICSRFIFSMSFIPIRQSIYQNIMKIVHLDTLCLIMFTNRSYLKNAL